MLLILLLVVLKVLKDVIFCFTFRAKEIVCVFDSEGKRELVDIFAADVLVPEFFSDDFDGLVFEGLIFHIIIFVVVFDLIYQLMLPFYCLNFL